MTTLLADLDVDSLRSLYRENGMVTLGRVLSDDEVRQVKHHVDRYVERVVKRLPETIRNKIVRFEDDGVSVRSCYSMQEVDGYFEAFGNSDVFKEIVRRIAGWEPELYGVETFNKPGRVGSKVPLHQEVAFHAPDMRPRAHLWLALDDVMPENGPVRFWIGAHAAGLLPHATDGHGYLVCDEDAATANAREIHTSLVPAGHATLHDGLIPHDSLPNRSSADRIGVLCAYVCAE